MDFDKYVNVEYDCDYDIGNSTDLPRRKLLSVSEPIFPNLDKIKNIILMDDHLELYFKSKGLIHLDIAFTIFPQLWESTGTGLSLIGGSSITEEYTTIVHERQSVLYAVFFGNKLAYAIEHPNELFFENVSKGYVEGVWNARHYGRNILN